MKSIVANVLAGDVLTVARLLRDMDDDIPGARECLKDLYPHTGRACIIGITGAPGTGKSTLTDKLTQHLRARGKSVGVIAVDPTSPFSGGAILGDRIRMQQHTLDEGVFIKSFAARGSSGGLSRSARAAVAVLDAMGKEYVIVETVGVGQGEVAIAKTAHTTVIVLIPGMGDNVQTVKAGILEAGDIFAVNKADRPGAEQTAGEISLMLDAGRNAAAPGGWRPPVLKVEALAGTGVAELMRAIDSHGEYLENMPPDEKMKRKKARIAEEVLEIAKDRMLQELLRQMTRDAVLRTVVDDIFSGKTDPYTACDTVILPAVWSGKA